MYHTQTNDANGALQQKLYQHLGQQQTAQQLNGQTGLGKPGIGGELDISIKRLHGLCERIGEIGVNLTGPIPTQAGIDANADGRPITSLASRSRDLTELISRLEYVVGRISDAL